MRLDPRHLSAQVSAFAAGDRGVIGPAGVTHEGHLVIIALKAVEDIHLLVLRAVDEWLRLGFRFRGLPVISGHRWRGESPARV